MTVSAMIIEDDADLGMIFERALQDAGYETTLVAEGTTVVEQLRANKPHLILLDLHLPGVSGFDILGQLRDDTQFDDLIIMVASADDRLTLDSAVADKANLVLQKPVHYSHLKLLAKRFLPRE